MKIHISKLLLTLTFGSALFAPLSTALGQGSGFTYQGQLTENGTPANGSYDLTLSLFASADSGSAVGTSNVFNALLISNGLFTVTLDFGAGAFNGAARWIEIGVRPGGSDNAYAKLNPRQPLTATPFALFSAGVVTAPPGMVLIPAGQFTMGDTLDGLNDALPFATTLSAFYMDANEVTLSQWRSVYHWATNHGYGFINLGFGRGPNYPVHSIQWYESVKWCNARSQLAGRTPVYYTDAEFTQVYTNGEVMPYANWSANGYRLPTEAEWEKAARGGLSGQRFPWGNVISHALANYVGNTAVGYDLGPNGHNAAFTNVTGVEFSSPGGSFAPNGYGLNNMAGNIAEWCWDWYGLPYAGGTDPHGPVIGTERIIRGGDWSQIPNFCRVAHRLRALPGYEDSWIGFRCVLTASQ